MRWHELGWTQLDKLDKNLPVVIPLGSCEQHGAHLPVFVDTLQVTAIADETERRLPDELILLPTLWLGSSHHHLDFPGTVSVLPSLYSEVVKSIATCVLAAGFRRILFLNGHGGNKVPAAQALSELVCESDAADAASLVLATWWELAEGLNEGMDTESLSHACEYETSLVLTLRPDLVRRDEALEASMAMETEWFRSEGVGRNRIAVFHRFHRLTAAGSMGRPSAANADKGRRIIDAVVERLVSLIQEMRTWPDLPPIRPANNLKT